MSEAPQIGKSFSPRGTCRAVTLLFILIAATGAAPAGDDAADRKRPVDAARERVAELEAKAFAERPDLKEVVDERAKWEAGREEAEKDEVEVRARRYLEAQRAAGHANAKEAHERLVDRWTVLRGVELLEELEKSGRAKLLLTEPLAVRLLMEHAKDLKAELPPDAREDPAEVWEVFLAQLVAAKPEIMRRIEKAKGDAGLPDDVAEQARRAGIRGAEFEYYHIYVSLRTPAELSAARDELQRLEQRGCGPSGDAFAPASGGARSAAASCRR